MSAVAPEPGAMTRTAPVLDVFVSRQGEGVCVGDEQLFIRFSGCNLACDYCDTPESIPQGRGQAKDLSALLRDVERLSGGRSLPVSITGGEPLLQVEFLKVLIPALKERGHRVYLETNGTLPKALEKVIDGCDWVSMDFKPASAVGRSVWEAHKWFLEAGGQKVFVKLVLTDQTTDAEVRQAVDLIAGVRRSIPLILQPATAWGASQSMPLARVVSCWTAAVQQLADVRVLPQIHRIWGIP